MKIRGHFRKKKDCWHLFFCPPFVSRMHGFENMIFFSSGPFTNKIRFLQKKGVSIYTFKNPIVYCFPMNFRGFFHEKKFGWYPLIIFVQIGIFWIIWIILLEIGVWGIFSTQLLLLSLNPSSKCENLAKKKFRKSQNWFFLGFLFGHHITTKVHFTPFYMQNLNIAACWPNSFFWKLDKMVKFWSQKHWK